MVVVAMAGLVGLVRGEAIQLEEACGVIIQVQPMHIAELGLLTKSEV